jgi:DNA repair exonuclease SbcCD ATPase subunit
LADRITARDPGNKPGPGDRIPFVYIHNADKKALQGEKIETPSFIRDNKIKIDYSFYITNQIMKPVQQVFALVLEKMWIMDGKKGKVDKLNMEIKKLKKTVDPEKLDDKIEYYFVVSDNDGVNGSKSTRSQINTYKLPSLEELNELRDEDQQKNKEDLSKLLKKTQEFKKNVEKLSKEIMNSKSNDWNKINKAEQLKEEQKSLIESLERLKNEMNQSIKEKSQLSEIDKEIMEKQDLIEKLLDDLMDDELKKLLDDLEKLIQDNFDEFDYYGTGGEGGMV